jgi:ApbE superfamily uncharacterized protein (UPF0280 family)
MKQNQIQQTISQKYKDQIYKKHKFVKNTNMSIQHTYVLHTPELTGPQFPAGIWEPLNSGPRPIQLNVKQQQGQGQRQLKTRPTGAISNVSIQ